MTKLTKIVATIGPSSDSEEMIEKLINAGVNIFRFNFKHNTVEWHNDRIARVNQVAKKMGVTVGTLIDLQGPEIRILMPQEQIELKKDDLLIFGEEAFSSKEKGISITHPQIIQHLKTGQKLLADDGTLPFFVEKVGSKTYLKCGTNGVLKNRKSLVIPGADFPFPVLVDRDFDGLKLVQKNEIDFIALSFVRSAQDLKTVKKEMQKNKIKAKLIAKIETRKALNDLDNIIVNCDGIMVARGDLGVELPIEEVPYYQKIIIKKSLEQGIPVITATQMLQSMVDNPYPTRAEVSDVANATYDLTDAVMLSGETASGKHPLEAVDMMRKTAIFNEVKFSTDTRIKYSFKKDGNTSLICESAYNLYLAMSKNKEKLVGFIVFTKTGKTARLLSNYRPILPIYAITGDKKTCDSLSINFAVSPYLKDSKNVHGSIDFLLKKDLVKKGQLLIVVQADLPMIEGSTSTVRITAV